MTDTQFNPLKARTNRPCPIWVRDFREDTMDLEADEIGVYFLFIMAMWAREDCALADNPKKLARLARLSPRLWYGRASKVILPFFEIEGHFLVSPKLRLQAESVQRFVAEQHCRKTGGNVETILRAFPWKTSLSLHSGRASQTGIGHTNTTKDKAVNSANLLETNNQGLTADTTVDVSADTTVDRSADTSIPIDQYKDDDDAGAGGRDPISEILTIRERILIAMGHDQSGLTANGRMVGSPADMVEFKRWIALGLSIQEIIDQVSHVCSQKKGEPPTSFKYFTKPMEELAGAKAAPPLESSKTEIKNAGNYAQPPDRGQKRRDSINRAAAGSFV